MFQKRSRSCCNSLYWVSFKLTKHSKFLEIKCERMKINMILRNFKNHFWVLQTPNLITKLKTIFKKRALDFVQNFYSKVLVKILQTTDMRSINIYKYIYICIYIYTISISKVSTLLLLYYLKFHDFSINM